MINLLGPYKYVLDAIIIGALIAGAVWLRHWDTTTQQKIGSDRVQQAWDKSDKDKAEAQRARELLLQKDKDDALALAAKDTENANAAAAASAAAKRVSDSTVAKLLASSTTASVETNRKYTSALASVFSECTAKYQQLGKDAQGHANDSLMFDRAWPK